MRRVSILGATGSIGKQALEVLSQFPHRFALEGLSVHRQIEALPELISRYRPKWVAVTDPSSYDRLVKETAMEGRFLFFRWRSCMKSFPQIRGRWF
jgi:1-deoxy-D-xylulose-5-phosphate reductoisomerase